MSTPATILLTWAWVAGPPLTTPPVPPAPSHNVPPREIGTPTTLFINYDGAVLQNGCGNDPHQNCSTLSGLFGGYVGPSLATANQKMAILQATRKDVEEFGIRVVVDRPPDDVDYTMVLYGDLGAQSFAGVAPYIDCADRLAGDTSFSQDFETSATGSTVILQEAAHTWGLEHVDAIFDILNPFRSDVSDQFFEDTCHQIVANTLLQPTPGSCNEIHTLFCEPGFQNSWQELLHLFGPAIPDTQSPQLFLTLPDQDAVFVAPVRIPLLGTIIDDLEPQFYQVEVVENGEVLYEDLLASVDLVIADPPPGDHTLVVRIADEAGNMGEDQVSFTILPEGSDPPVSETPAYHSDESGCHIPSPPRTSATGLWGLAVVLLARRRPFGRA